jgi:transcriptional regulator NrdR family protein
MNCPDCNNKSYVLETRKRKNFMSRRYECANCKQKFITHETISTVGIRVTNRIYTKEHMEAMRSKSTRGKVVN